MDVLLFYPADKRAYRRALPAVYASRLHGRSIIDPNDPNRWVPMSYAFEAEKARDGVAVDQHGPRFPLIVYSHPNTSDPQNPAPTLERLASHGYVVAAPWHEGDTREDDIIDRINTAAGTKILPCFDGGPSPCSDAANFPKVIRNRALDVAALLDEIPRYFGDRVDMQRVGLLGQSRGSLTAFAAAGGSTTLNLPAEPRIKAIMMLANGMRSFVTQLNLADITVPSLFITSKGDRNAGVPSVQMAVSVEAFNTIPDSTMKGLVILERADHAAYSSNRCAQMQATGAVLQQEPRAIGEKLLFENIMISAGSGIGFDFCRFDSFVDPVDIRGLVRTIPGLEGFEVTESTVPRNLGAATTMRVVVELADTFFDGVLVKHDHNDARFKGYLKPKFLLKKEGEVVSYAEIQTSKGRAVACDDPDLLSLDPSCAADSD